MSTDGSSRPHPGESPGVAKPPDSPGVGSDRGIGFQAVGFAVVGCASVAVLQVWSESGSWAYESFEIAVSRLYWAFVVPLAALFDWGRKMFETRAEIRKAAVEKEFRRRLDKALPRAVEQALQQALQQERRRILAFWEQYKDLPREEVERKILNGKQP